mmetsp:Transcript_25464/g.52949  ORF Transcript_25464/g.52949 Transcript_25464/m.52949 type:complete len:616 (-) Transcript_25464:40-1887(-)
MVKLVLLALLALSSGLKLSDKQEFDYDHLQSSIVRIQTVGASFDWFRPFNPQDGQVSLGSGFIVQTEPYILIATNQHVINDALRVQVQLLLHSQMKWDVQIVSACPKFDLALLTLKDDQGFKATLRKAHLEVQPLILSQHVAEMGEDVVALGFPLGQNSLKISKGNVAGNEIVSNNLCIQSTAPISPGNSGGPLLDTAGKEVLGVNFAGATRGENINYVIPAFRVQALINLHLKEQQSPPWIRGGFKTPGHGLVIIHPNEALYNYSEGCKEGVFVGRVHDDGFMSKAKPALQEGSMLLSVAGRPLDRFSKADIKDLMHGKAALEDLFFIQSDLKSDVSFQSCLKGKITDHKVNTSKTPDFDQGIVFVDEPVTDGWTQQYEIFGDVGVMAMTQNHVAEAFARSGSPKITRWLLPERAIKPRLMITYVRPGSYASEILAEGSAVEKVNGKLVRTLEEWREALVPDSGSIWTLETDLGILLASPFKETLSTQLQRGKVDAYLLTQGIEQANEKLSNASAATTSTTAEQVVEEETMEVSTTSKPQKEAAGWFDWFQLMEEESRAAKRPISGEFLRHVSMMQLDTPRAAGPLKVSRRKGALVVEGSHAEKVRQLSDLDWL